MTARREEARYSEREMFEMLIKLAEIRHEKWQHVPIDTWPKLSELGENVVLGSFSWLGQTSRTRWIQRSTSVSLGPYLSTPSDVAKDYIKIKYPTRRRVSTGQYHEIMKRRSHPLYAITGTWERAVYVDLISAYWSILKVVGWDADYYPGHWLGIGASMSDFPFRDVKLVRNCLITQGLPGKVNYWSHSHQTIKQLNKRASHVNVMIWCLAQDILNGVATDVIDAGAQYVHTDGYIIPEGFEGSVRAKLDGWGLAHRDKHRGLARIYGPGTYDIGERLAKRHLYLNQSLDHTYKPIRLDWLRDRFRRAGERCPTE